MNNLGIVYNQSAKNTLIIFLGFAIGGINVLFLYTHFLEPEYFGLITFILSAANLIMPLMVFGMQHTIVKFFTSYQSQSERDNFLWTVLFIPMLFILPMALLGTVFYQKIASFLARENQIIEQYAFLIFLVGVCMGYFELFYAWSRVQLKSVFGSFVREVFARVCVSLLLMAVYLNWIDAETFVYGVAVVYVLRVLIMKLYAFYLYMPKWSKPTLPGNMREILRFSLYMILAGSAGTILLEIDKFMIPQLEEIAQVAYYSVGVYIASVIAIPSRAMQQIIGPITAKELNAGNAKEVEHLYKRSALNLTLVGCLLFLLINCNIVDLYALIGKPEYSAGMTIVLVISLSELVKLSLGNNGAILTNSKYYRVLFYLSVCMALMVILLNRWLIEEMGIFGAALATFIVVLVFSVYKVYFLYVKMKMSPYSFSFVKILALTALIMLLSTYLPLPFGPFWSILLRSILIVVLFVGAALSMKLSQDFQLLYRNLLGKLVKKN